jgi:hypothetical protein
VFKEETFIVKKDFEMSDSIVKESFDLETLLKTSPEDLNKLQCAAIRQHISKVLKSVLFLIQKSDWCSLQELLVESPSGGWGGMDSYFINFSWSDKERRDLFDVLEDLREREKKISPDTNEY